MKLDVWPVVTREAIVSAYRRLPAGDSEAPFRTLRKNQLVTAGRRLETREGRRLKGSVTMFSSLNVDAARLARHGLRQQAADVARLAAEVEASPEWWLLLRMVAEGMATPAKADRPASGSGWDLDSAAASAYWFAVRDFSAFNSPGEWSRDRLLDSVFDGSQMPEAIAYAMRGIARHTQAARVQVADQLRAISTATVGEVASLSDQVAVLRTSDGSEYAIPRAMAHSAHRDHVGALVALISERVSDTVSVFEVTPAFDLEIKVGRSAETLVRTLMKMNAHGWPADRPRPKYWPGAWNDYAPTDWLTDLSSPMWRGHWVELVSGVPTGTQEATLVGADESERVVADAVAPATEASDADPGAPYSPFDRHDPRTFALTVEEAEILARPPAAGREHHRGPRLLVPVRIEG